LMTDEAMFKALVCRRMRMTRRTRGTRPTRRRRTGVSTRTGLSRTRVSRTGSALGWAHL
jgi:hypothetical protein